jgi:putative ABC transport system permease protein
MNIFNRLTIKTLRANRVRTLVTIIGMILSTAMFCAVTTFTASLQQYMKEIAIRQSGDYYGETIAADQAQVETVRDAEEISQLAIAQEIGYARIPEITNPDKPYLFLLGADGTFFQTMPVRLTSGRMPQTESELLLPEHLASNGGVKYQLNDTLTLDVGQRMVGNEPLNQYNPYLVDEESGEVAEVLRVEEQKTYTVVGFYERPGFENYSAPGYTALTTFSGTLTDNGVYDIYYKTHNPKEI